MAATIEAAFPGVQVELKPGGRGDFIVTCETRTVWDKKVQDDRFPEENEVVRRLKDEGFGV